MIAPTTWLAFLVTALVVAAAPGPTALLLVSYGLTLGRRGALLTVPAVMLGDVTAMALSLAGLGAIIASTEALFTLLKLAGAAYLFVLGIRMWRAPSPSPLAATTVATAPPRRGRAGRCGVTSI